MRCLVDIAKSNTDGAWFQTAPFGCVFSMRKEEDFKVVVEARRRLLSLFSLSVITVSNLLLKTTSHDSREPVKTLVVSFNELFNLKSLRLHISLFLSSSYSHVITFVCSYHSTVRPDKIVVQLCFSYCHVVSSWCCHHHHCLHHQSSSDLTFVGRSLLTRPQLNHPNP